MSYAVGDVCRHDAVPHLPRCVQLREISRGTTMTVHGRHRASRRKGSRGHLGLAVVAGGMGIAAATVTGHDVAWAETGASDAGAQSTTDGSSAPGASDPAHRVHL